MNLKLIIAFLTTLIVIQIIGALLYFFWFIPRQNEVTTISTSNSTEVIQNNTPGKGSIKLQSEKTTFTINEDIPVAVIINTDQKPVEGVDLSLKYDPTIIEPLLVNELPFIPGRLFSETPLNSFNNRTGVASMSAITSLTQNFSGEGTLALITFKAKKSGSTSITIQAEPNNTTDSNMVSDGTEILSTTENLSLKIQ